MLSFFCSNTLYIGYFFYYFSIILQLSVTAGAQAKATEKLSSGYRINRAGDDAAGLTISEKMRSQIRV